MRFFIPATNNSREAEELHSKIRDHVAASDGPVVERRIYRLKYQHDGVPETVVVGSDKHRFGAGPVVAIFEASDGHYYVCTQRTSTTDVERHKLPTNAVVEAEDFSALA